MNGLFTPGSTNMANVAHFMCEFATNATTWAEWKSKMPVIVNAEASTVAVATLPKRALAPPAGGRVKRAKARRSRRPPGA